MPGLSGFEVLKEMKEVNTNLVVIVITGHGSMDNAYEAVQYRSPGNTLNYKTSP